VLVRPVVFLSCALMALPNRSSLLAQVAADTTRLSDLVVTAARLETPRSSVSAAVTVVTGAELRERGLRFLSDWLAEVPGAAVVTTGSFGGVTSLFLRGGESDYTKVLVDGVAVNQPGGSLDLANLSTESIDRIEVVRGPASVLYGSDAVTGVIQIFTRGGGTGRLSALARAGTFGTSDLRASYGGRATGMTWSAGVSRFGSDGSYPFNNDYRSWTADARVQATPDDRTDLALTTRYGDHVSHFPTDFNGVPTDSNQFTAERGLTLGVDGGRRLGERVEVRALATLFDSRRGFDDQADGPADSLDYGFASTRRGTVTRRALDLRANVRPAAAVVLTGGAELSRESERVTDQTTSNFGEGRFTEVGEFEQARRNTGLYAQALAGFGEAVDAQAGIRLDLNEVFGTFATWRAGLVYRPADGLRLRAAVGTSFKQPTFSEQFARSPFETGNPDLDPERALSWEAGVEGNLAGSRVTLSATWFDQRFRDLIQYLSAAPGLPTYSNVASATARGLELGGGWIPWRPLQLTLGWTLLQTRVDQAGPDAGPAFAPGTALLRRPASTVTAALHYRPGFGGQVSMDAVFTGARDDMDYREFPASRVTLARYSVLNVSADIPFAGLGGLAVTLQARNVLNAQYVQVVGYPGLGRTILAGVRWGP
jgi:vitamin B12 transporter